MPKLLTGSVYEEKFPMKPTVRLQNSVDADTFLKPFEQNQRQLKCLGDSSESLVEAVGVAQLLVVNMFSSSCWVCAAMCFNPVLCVWQPLFVQRGKNCNQASLFWNTRTISYQKRWIRTTVYLALHFQFPVETPRFSFLQKHPVSDPWRNMFFFGREKKQGGFHQVISEGGTNTRLEVLSLAGKIFILWEFNRLQQLHILGPFNNNCLQ